MMDITRKPKMGLLLIGANRFRPLGKGTADGTYEQRKEKEAEAIVASAKKIADVVFTGIVYDKDMLAAAMDAFYNEKVDFVFCAYLSWAEDFAWVRFLRDMYNIPLFFGCIMRESCEFSDTSDENEFVDFLSSGGIVGTLEASGSLARFNRKMVATGIGKLDTLMNQVSAFGQAAKVRSILRNSVFGLLACYNEAMWSTYVDPYNFFATVGPELRFLSIATLNDEINLLSEQEVQKTVEELTAKYSVMPDVGRDKFFASVRASMAVEKMLRKNDLDMIILNDIDRVLFEQVGLRPGFIPCSHKDAIVVPEGDIGAGLAVFVLKVLSGKHVSFIEPFYIDAKSGCFGAGHAGPNDYTDPSGSVKIARDVRFAKTSYKHAGAPFAWYKIPPGEKTMVHISENNGRYKLVCSLVDALECEHFLASYSHGVLKPRSPIDIFFGKLMEIGVTQHYGLVEGNYVKELEAFAKIMDFEYYHI